MIYLLDLLLQYWPEMGLIFTDIVCRNGIPLTDNKYMYECIFLWCLDIDNDNGTLVILMCGRGGNLSNLPCNSVCVTGHWYVRYVWIMRWWCSNLIQWPLRNLGSIAYCYIAYFWTCPPPPPDDWCPYRKSSHYCFTSPSTNNLPVTAWDRPPTQASPVSVSAYREHLAAPSTVALRVQFLLPSLSLATHVVAVLVLQKLFGLYWCNLYLY